MMHPVRTAMTYNEQRRMREWREIEPVEHEDDALSAPEIVGAVLVGIGLFATLGLALCGLVWGLTR